MNSTTNLFESINKKSRILFIAVALSQSIFLFAIQHFFSTDTRTYSFLTTWTIVWGLYLLLANNSLRSLRLVLSAGLVSHTGSLMFTWPLATTFLNDILLIIALYAGHAFLRVYHQRSSAGLEYENYFLAVWEDFCILFSAALFSLLAWGILILWAALFSSIGIRFFDNLFFDEKFVVIVTPLMYVAAMYITYQQNKIVFYLLKIVIGFGKVLLPFLLLSSILYLIVWLLGIFYHPLVHYSFGHTNYYLVTFLFFGIVCVNAVYTDGKNVDKISTLYRSIITVFFIFQFAMSLLAMGLLIQQLVKNSLIQQDNFSLAFATSFLFIYWCCYFCVWLLNQKPWLSGLGKINIRIAWIFIILCVLVNNPLSARFIVLAKTSLPFQETKNFLQADLSKTGLVWINAKQKGDIPTLVLGYQYQQPLYACRVQRNEFYYMGFLEKSYCVVEINRTIFHLPDYQLLAGKAAIYWVPYLLTEREQDFSVLGTYSKKNPQQDGSPLCRTIYENQIYIGNFKAYNCWIVAKNQLVKSNFYQILRVKTSAGNE